MPARSTHASVIPEKTSKEVFAQAFHNSPAMQTVTRLADRRVIEVNEAFLKTLGYTREEVVCEMGIELNHWVSPEESQRFRAELFAKGAVRDFEARVRTKAGVMRTVLLSADVVDIGGQPHVVAAGVDITPRQEAEARLRESELRLRESEARFSTAFNASPLYMTIGTRHDGRFVEVNDAFVQGLGLTRVEAVGRNSAELNIWANLEERNRFYEQLQQTGSLHNVECQIRHRDGTARTMQLSAESVEINHVPHLLTFGVDITQRKQAEQRLLESEVRARALYQSISAAVVVQDETGFVQANPAALKLVGATRPGEFLGRRPEDFSAPFQAGGEPTPVAVQRHIVRTQAEGWDHFEWLARRLDGSFVPVEVTLTMLQLEGRTVIQSVMFDLTERKRAEAELQNALSKERELNQLKSDFVALVSHEFRTPLEIIMSSVDNLDRYHERLAPEKRAELLRTINKSVRRMTGMMEDVLLLGRLDSGGTTFRPLPLNLALLGQRICDEMESATNRRCPITFRTEGELTGAEGDEAVLRHILTNLLSNAVKYSEPNQPVELDVRREGPMAVIRITDHGCGILAADQPRLFQAFHRGGNVRQVPGTGLGLLIVRRCVALHGGEIEFESVEGQGTRFTVRLPLFGD